MKSLVPKRMLEQVGQHLAAISTFIGGNTMFPISNHQCAAILLGCEPSMHSGTNPLTDQALPRATPHSIAAPPSPWTAKARRRFLNLEDFEREARRVLPPMLFVFVSEGVETNASLEFNRTSFQDYAFMPSVLRGVSGRSQKVNLLGCQYDHPFGIAPMGGSALCAYRADLSLGSAAHASNIPMIVSAAAAIRLEEIRAAAPTAWFQTYLPAEEDRIIPMIDRVAAAGYETLVLTVDIPVGSNREHYVRSGFSIPVRPSLSLAWQGISHPRWLFGTALRTYWHHGMPHIENTDAYRGAPFLSRAATRQSGQRDALNWESFSLIRRRWKGRLVVKGILSPADAAKAEQLGADAVIISNHGGRQLDGVVAPIRVLPRVRDAVKKIPVIVDGGIRRGTDVLKALALGADFVLVGRPLLYAAVAGDEPGVAHAIGLLSDEIDRDMAMLGVRTLGELSTDHLDRGR